MLSICPFNDLICDHLMWTCAKCKAKDKAMVEEAHKEAAENRTGKTT